MFRLIYPAALQHASPFYTNNFQIEIIGILIYIIDNDNLKITSK